MGFKYNSNWEFCFFSLSLSLSRFFSPHFFMNDHHLLCCKSILRKGFPCPLDFLIVNRCYFLYIFPLLFQEPKKRKDQWSINRGGIVAAVAVIIVALDSLFLQHSTRKEYKVVFLGIKVKNPDRKENEGNEGNSLNTSISKEENKEKNSSFLHHTIIWVWNVFSSKKTK